MKVVHLTRFDSGDGPSGAVYRLHKALLGLGIDSTMFVAQTRSGRSDPTVKVLKLPMDFPRRLRRHLLRLQISRGLARNRKSRPSGYEAFSDDRSPIGADVVAQLPPCDLINVHAMLGFVDYRTFFTTVPKHTPVVRTLHDMSFFTGGCHHDFGCGKHAERCGACPQLGRGAANDLSRQVWERKRSALKTVGLERLHVVAPSAWLAAEARRSSLLRQFPITVIPHGVDTEDFRPRDRGAAREVLGVPQDARVVLFVAEPITRRVKGFSLLAQALEGLGHLTNLLLISVGSGSPPAEVSVPHMRLGYIGSERILSLVYSVADVFVMPSLREAFGLTALEATACGIPVVGFDVGGVPQVVRAGVTGLLVPPEDVVALRAAIGELLQDPARRADMAANCRRLAVEEYSIKVQAQQYAELYDKIVPGADTTVRGGW